MIEIRILSLQCINVGGGRGEAMTKEKNIKVKSESNENKLNMRELGLEIFPELDEVSAERKASSTFKRACHQMGIEPSVFKDGKEYRIPAESVVMWRLLLRNINAVEGNPSRNGYVNFVEDVIYSKREVDEQMKEIHNPEADNPSFQQSMGTVYDLFYTPTVHGQSIAMMFHNEINQTIKKDIDYILQKAPADRTVIYTEMYFTEIMNKAEKMGSLTRKMINEKWNEQ